MDWLYRVMDSVVDNDDIVIPVLVALVGTWMVMLLYFGLRLVQRKRETYRKARGVLIVVAFGAYIGWYLYFTCLTPYHYWYVHPTSYRTERATGHIEFKLTDDWLPCPECNEQRIRNNPSEEH